VHAGSLLSQECPGDDVKNSMHRRSASYSSIVEITSMGLYTIAFLTVVIYAWISVCDGAYAGELAVNVGSEKQLFIDDRLIASTNGVTLTMNPPRKTGEKCIVADKPWESHRVCAYNTVIEDDGVYKMWYDAIASDGSRWLCYATSKDGAHWDKPALGIVPFGEHRNTNIVFPMEKRDHEPGCVFIDTNPKCPPDQRYKMVCSYAGPGGPGTYVFASNDGLHWRPMSDKPSFRSSDTGNVAFFDNRLGRYVAYVRMWAPMRKIGRCKFDDLTSWGAEKLVFGYDDQDPPDLDLYTNAAVKYPFAQNVYLIFPSAYFHYPEAPEGKFRNDGPLDVRLAVSRDSVRWSYVDRRPFVGLGVHGDFDDSTIYMTTGMIRKGAELWMYYNGADFTHGAYDMAADRYKGTISRVVLRLDGFVSVDAAYSGGELVTVPLVFTGKRLVLNVETSVAGSVAIELLGRDGKPVEGHAIADADVVKGNFIEKTVTWKGNDDLGRLAGKPVQLRFVMRDAKLYAFQFQD